MRKQKHITQQQISRRIQDARDHYIRLYLRGPRVF